MGIDRLTDLSKLPRKNGRMGKVDWAKSIGCNVHFRYDGICGYITLVEKNGDILSVKYLDNDIFKISTYDLSHCKIRALIGLKTSRFKVSVGDEFKDDKRNIIITDREYRDRVDKKGNDKWYKYTCNKCGWTEGWMVEANLLSKNNGCSCCSSSPKVVVEGINDLCTTDYWMVELGVDEGFSKTHNRGSGKDLLIVCPYCKRKYYKKANAIYSEKSISCTCGDGKSYIHKYMTSLLNQSNVVFQQEVSFGWCSYFNEYKNKNCIGIYDFVIESYKLIIETDGGWHRKDNNLSGQTKEESFYIDYKKDLLAKRNGYNVIRINDIGDFGKNILSSNLVDFIDMECIDFKVCDSYALSNIVKTVCDYWNGKRSDENTGDLINKFGLDRKTIGTYLKKGNKNGWCIYNPIEEMRISNRKNAIRNATRCSKEVEIFKENVSLGTFPSTCELERVSESLFGVKLIHSKIGAVCNRKINRYKGFGFRYTDDIIDIETVVVT